MIQLKLIKLILILILKIKIKIKKQNIKNGFATTVQLYAFEIILKKDIDINKIGDQNVLTTFDLRFDYNPNPNSNIKNFLVSENDCHGIDTSSSRQPSIPIKIPKKIKKIKSNAASAASAVSAAGVASAASVEKIDRAKTGDYSYNYNLKKQKAKTIAEELRELIINGSSDNTPANLIHENNNENKHKNENKNKCECECELIKQSQKLSKSPCQNVSRHNLMIIPKLDENLHCGDSSSHSPSLGNKNENAIENKNKNQNDNDNEFEFDFKIENYNQNDNEFENEIENGNDNQNGIKNKNKINLNFSFKKKKTLTLSHELPKCKSTIKVGNQTLIKRKIKMDDGKNNLMKKCDNLNCTNNIYYTNNKKPTKNQTWKNRARNWYEAESKFIFASINEAECEKWINLLKNLVCASQDKL